MTHPSPLLDLIDGADRDQHTSPQAMRWTPPPPQPPPRPGREDPRLGCVWCSPGRCATNETED